MKDICADVKSNASKVIAEWERLAREEPWYSLPAEHPIDNLPEVVVRLVEASLCDPHNREAHRQQTLAAAAHGVDRRRQDIPDYTILTEYHLLRRALWRYITQTFGSSERTTRAILRIDIAISVATNASMWGYYRPEIEALGKWEHSIDRLTDSSPLLRSQVD